MQMKSVQPRQFPNHQPLVIVLVAAIIISVNFAVAVQSLDYVVPLKEN